MIYSYTSVLAFWIIATNYFCIDALSKSWVLSKGLEIGIDNKGGISDKNNIDDKGNIDEDSISNKGLAVDFYYKDYEKKEKEGWMDILNKLEIRFSI